jgi:hypothetical protein
MGTRKLLPFRSQASRDWSIRAKIISLLLVPLLTLVLMWALATAVTLGPGVELLNAQASVQNVGRPAQALLTELQEERRLTVAYVAAGRRNPAALTAQRAETDAAIDTFRRMSGSAEAQDAAGDGSARRLADFDAELGAIAVLRDGVNRGEVDRAAAMRRYTQIVDSSFSLFGTLVHASTADLDVQARAILRVSRAAEVLAQEDAVVTGAVVAGTFAEAELSHAVQLIGAQRFLFAEAVSELHVTDRQDYQGLARTEPFVRLAELENTILTRGRSGATVPIEPAAWAAAYTGVTTQLHDFQLRMADRIVERAEPAALVIFGHIIVAGLLGLITVIVTIIASIRIGRSIIKRLAGLRQAALELAVDRLPRVVHRLRRGESVDVLNEAPPLPYSDDEIGQVGRAFNELQRTAVNSAIEEANVRQGLNEVFLNIARRSQTLLHRQLSILDRMERRATDPVELEDLFRVDHLATRMRRHAEDLVILAGAAPGRGWRNPVAIVDVLRGAVSEVEDYSRVSIQPMPEIGAVGRAVADVIHLLAELIENATAFSPPHTRVTVAGEFVANGFAIEIEDRGLGMAPEALAQVNRRLAEPPEFDPANSAQLGLFVVARLAARQGIKVQLRPSAYGGVAAVALVPEELIVPGDFAGPRQAVAALPAGPQPAGVVAHASADGDANGAAGHYRQLSTGQRPAITSGADPGRVPVKATPRHARSDVVEPLESAGPDGLPRRVRQTSLAPQLREAPPDADAALRGDIPTQSPGTRSPEELRAMMTSFQTGMARGRRDAEEDGLNGSTSEREAE